VVIAIAAMFALTGAVVLSVTASPAAACCVRWNGNSDDHREDYDHRNFHSNK
jgi:hypothetical protein